MWVFLFLLFIFPCQAAENRIEVNGWFHPNGVSVKVSLDKQCQDKEQVFPQAPKTIAQMLKEEPVLFLMGALVRRERGKGTREFIRTPKHIRPNKNLQNYAILKFEQGLGDGAVTITNITKIVMDEWAKCGVVNANPQHLCHYALGLQVAQRVYEKDLSSEV